MQMCPSENVQWHPGPSTSNKGALTVRCRPPPQAEVRPNPTQPNPTQPNPTQAPQPAILPACGKDSLCCLHKTPLCGTYQQPGVPQLSPPKMSSALPCPALQVATQKPQRPCLSGRVVYNVVGVGPSLPNKGGQGDGVPSGRSCGTRTTLHHAGHVLRGGGGGVGWVPRGGGFCVTGAHPVTHCPSWSRGPSAPHTAPRRRLGTCHLPVFQPTGALQWRSAPS